MDMRPFEAGRGSWQIVAMSPEERHRLMQAGQGAFNRGDFFLAHEHWEAVWLKSAPPERAWIQGLIQLATALFKLSAGRPDLAISLLTKGLAKLSCAPATLDALDLSGLRRTLTVALAELRAQRPVDAQAVKLEGGRG